MAVTNADGTIILKTQVDQTGLNKGLTTMKSGVKSLTGAFMKLGSVVGLAMGIKALVQFGKEAINLASDLEEVQNVVDVAFGDMSYKIEEFSKTAIENFGISELTAKRTASTYMAMAKGMGIVDDVASDMAITMTGLTADLASFYNISQERADIILKSVYTGETETLKQLGIIMTEVNLQNFAMSRGITKSLSAMTQQEKTMLRYQFVLEQTRLASGDFVRTQDSWANQTRILSERWKEVQVTFGEAFMTIGTLVLPVVNKVIKGISKIAEVAKIAAQWIYKAFTGQNLQAVEKQGSVVEEVSGGFSEGGENIEQFGNETEKASKKISKSLAGFDELNTITQDIADSTATTNNGGFFSDFGGATFEDVIPEENVVSNFEKSLESLEKKIKNIFNSKTFKNLSSLWGNFLADLKNSVKKWAPEITDSFQDVFVRIKNTVFQPAVNLITRIWENFTADLSSLWNRHGNRLLDNISEFINNVIGLFRSLYDNIIKPIIEPLLNMFSKLWKEHLRGMLFELGDFIGELANGTLEIYNKFISPIIEWLLKTLKPAWSDLWTDISGVLGRILGVITDTVTSIISSLKYIVMFITGVFTGNWEKAWQGIVGLFKNIVGGMVEILKVPINHIIEHINSFINGINKIKLPNWDALGNLAGKGINIPKIPKLAQGAVVPPNREFLAVLGDNKRENEIVSPVSEMKRAFREEFAQMSGFSGRIEVPIYLDGRQIAIAVREAEDNFGSQTVFGGFANAY